MRDDLTAESLFFVACQVVMEDGLETEGEAKFLTRMAATLGIDPATADRILRRARGEEARRAPDPGRYEPEPLVLYRRACFQAGIDGTVTPEERVLLDRLAAFLGISPPMAAPILAQVIEQTGTVDYSAPEDLPTSEASAEGVPFHAFFVILVNLGVAVTLGLSVGAPGAIPAAVPPFFEPFLLCVGALAWASISFYLDDVVAMGQVRPGWRKALAYSLAAAQLVAAGWVLAVFLGGAIQEGANGGVLLVVFAIVLPTTWYLLLRPAWYSLLWARSSLAAGPFERGFETWENLVTFTATGCFAFLCLMAEVALDGDD